MDAITEAVFSELGAVAEVYVKWYISENACGGGCFKIPFAGSKVNTYTKDELNGVEFTFYPIAEADTAAPNVAGFSLIGATDLVVVFYSVNPLPESLPAVIEDARARALERLSNEPSAISLLRFLIISCRVGVTDGDYSAARRQIELLSSELCKMFTANAVTIEDTGSDEFGYFFDLFLRFDDCLPVDTVTRELTALFRDVHELTGLGSIVSATDHVASRFISGAHIYGRAGIEPS